MKKRMLALVLALALLLALPTGAMAAKKKASIKFTAKVGLMLEGETAALKPKLKNVKLADLTHNMDIRRIKDPGPKDYDRIEKKYKPAYEYLKGERDGK